jgi:CDP-2,3-bis-(O-geranylgeranyl)-sn-glycerol synthase
LTESVGDGQELVEFVYLMLPAYLANMAPPFVKYWRGWNPAIHRHWLGAHKTMLGFSLGVGAGITAAFLQSRIGLVGKLFPQKHWFWFGLTMGVAAMLGDAAKSFFKRRLGIAPGKRWVPADQLDFILAGLVVLLLWVPLPLNLALWIIVLSFIGDIAVNHISFYLGIRESKWWCVFCLMVALFPHNLNSTK